MVVRKVHTTFKLWKDEESSDENLASPTESIT